MSQVPASRNRYEKRNVIKNRIRKSVKIKLINNRKPNAKSFSKKALEKIRGMSFRIISIRLDIGIVFENQKSFLAVQQK